MKCRSRSQNDITVFESLLERKYMPGEMLLDDDLVFYIPSNII